MISGETDSCVMHTRCGVAAETNKETRVKISRTRRYRGICRLVVSFCRGFIRMEKEAEAVLLICLYITSSPICQPSTTYLPELASLDNAD